MTDSSNNLSERLVRSARQFIAFFRFGSVLKNLVGLLGASILFVLLVMLWLRIYTQHGQQIPVENYLDALIMDATRDAKSKRLRMVVEDSIFVVGRAGGIILAQNPRPGSKVKKNRRIYVTITKTAPDLIPLASLPPMYGHEINSVRKSLQQRFAIQSEILANVFDDGPPNMVMAVLYQGDTLVDARRKSDDFLVPKGGLLHFIVSKDRSDQVRMPDLECVTLAEADFILRANQLQFGEIHLDENVTQRQSAWVYRQEPPFAPGTWMEKGDSLSVWLSQVKPARCPADTLDDQE
jgi:beta-lactam-binding protein with PASTA domain